MEFEKYLLKHPKINKKRYRKGVEMSNIINEKHERNSPEEAWPCVHFFQHNLINR
jgi:hypothetical protein